MGAWGERPFENDVALDWIAPVRLTLTRNKILKALSTTDEYEKNYLIRAAARKMLIPFLRKDYELAVEKLQEVLNDEEWINSWKSPKKIREEINKQIADLKLAQTTII